MPRRPRLYIEGFPQHVIQRGASREACLYSDAGLPKDTCVNYSAILPDSEVEVLTGRKG